MPKDQSFNDWNNMLGEIYDKTQNYSKSAYEIYCHLAEVTGGFGKYFIKKKNFEIAKGFFPSIFAWCLALIRKVTDNQRKLIEVDKLIYKKFPGLCPYCLKAPCECGENKKPIDASNSHKLKDIISEYSYRNPDERIKSIQEMLKKIYLKTWDKYKKDRESEEGKEKIKLINDKDIAHYNITYLYSRLVEELAEIAESIRFYHLYRSNFENEVADFFAWLFAIISVYNKLYDEPEKNKIDIEEMLWQAYPGFCVFCNMPKCVCRPGPVRELLSRPSTDEYENYDEETQTENQAKLKIHIGMLKDMGILNKSIFPISIIKITISNYSEIKTDKETLVNFLRDLSSILRKKIRYDKDKFYRKTTDELLILCHDTMDKEVQGLKERIENLMGERKLFENYPTIKLIVETNTFTITEELDKILA